MKNDTSITEINNNGSLTSAQRSAVTKLLDAIAAIPPTLCLTDSDFVCEPDPDDNERRGHLHLPMNQVRYSRMIWNIERDLNGKNGPNSTSKTKEQMLDEIKGHEEQQRKFHEKYSPEEMRKLRDRAETRLRCLENGNASVILHVALQAYSDLLQRLIQSNQSQAPHGGSKSQDCAET